MARLDGIEQRLIDLGAVKPDELTNLRAVAVAAKAFRGDVPNCHCDRDGDCNRHVELEHELDRALADLEAKPSSST